MRVDEAWLGAHRSFTSEALGISERFVDLRAGPARTPGILSRPLGGPRSPWPAICQPFVHALTRGEDFPKEIRASQIRGEMAPGRGVGQTMDGLQAELQTDGTVNIQGWLLHREMFEQLQRLDLLRDLERFAGRALLLQLS